MGYAVIAAQFHHLGIYQHQFYFFGPGLIEYAGYDGVYAYAFSRTCGSGDEKMGHFGQIRHYGIAAYIFSHGKHKFRFVGTELFGTDYFPERHYLSLFVFNLYTHGGLAGDRCFHPQTFCPKIKGYVVGQIHYLLDLYSCARLYLVSGNRRSFYDICHFGFHIEAPQCVLQKGRSFSQGISQAFFASVKGCFLQQIKRRKDISPVIVGVCCLMRAILFCSCSHVASVSSAHGSTRRSACCTGCHTGCRTTHTSADHISADQRILSFAAASSCSAGISVFTGCTVICAGPAYYGTVILKAMPIRRSGFFSGKKVVCFHQIQYIFLTFCHLFWLRGIIVVLIRNMGHPGRYRNGFFFRHEIEFFLFSVTCRLSFFCFFSCLFESLLSPAFFSFGPALDFFLILQGSLLRHGLTLYLGFLKKPGYGSIQKKQQAYKYHYSRENV